MEQRNVSFKLPADLHQRIKTEVEAQGWTMGQFFELAAQGYFDKEKGGNDMGTTRTLAFTVSEELFQKVKEYLAWHQRKYGRRLTQKEFMLGLLEDAIEEMNADTAAQQSAEEPERQDAGGEAEEEAVSAPESAAEGSEDGWSDKDPEVDESPTAEENPLEDTQDAEEDQDSPEDAEDNEE